MKKKKEINWEAILCIWIPLIFIIGSIYLLGHMAEADYIGRPTNQTEEPETYHFTFINTPKTSCQSGALRYVLNKESTWNKEKFTFVCEDTNITTKCSYNKSTNRAICRFP